MRELSEEEQRIVDNFRTMEETILAGARASAIKYNVDRVKCPISIHPFDVAVYDRASDRFIHIEVTFLKKKPAGSVYGDFMGREYMVQADIEDTETRIIPLT